jgi:hypothetical protein
MIAREKVSLPKIASILPAADDMDEPFLDVACGVAVSTVVTGGRASLCMDERWE